MELESDDYTNCKLCSCYSHQSVPTDTEELENSRSIGDHPNDELLISARILRRGDLKKSNDNNDKNSKNSTV